VSDEVTTELTEASAVLRDMRAVLTSGDPTRTLPASVLSLSSDADTPELARLLCRILYDTLEAPNGIQKRRGALNFNSIEELAQTAGLQNGSAHIHDALEYLALYGVVDRFFVEHGFDREVLDRVVFSIYDFFTRDHGEALLERLQCSPDYREDSFSARMLDAHVLSTFDREAAARCFQLARDGNRDMWGHPKLDVGSASYLSHEYVQRHAAALAGYRSHLLGSHWFVTAMPRWAPGNYLYVCPCDRTFFRIYFPLWLNMAEYLRTRGVSLHFLLYADREEAPQLVEEAASLCRALATLRGDRAEGYPGNISFSAVPIPSDIANPVGFYVSGRFLMARRIGTAYEGPVLLHDIDMFFREDPRPYLDALDSERISVQLGSSSLVMLKPWRRFLGGTLVLPFTERAHAGLAPLENYLVAGLPLERWMTDQNAFAYLVERAIAAGEPETLISVLGGPRHGQPVRPTAGELIRPLLEGGQRRDEASEPVLEAGA
jgi:hypothetical protein